MRSAAPRSSKTLRLILGLRQVDLAEGAGVSRQLVGALERGERVGYGPGAERVQRVLTLLARGAARGLIEESLREAADAAGLQIGLEKPPPAE